MASRPLFYVFLLLALNALVSKIVLLIRHDNAHDACIKTYNIDPADGGTCHPDENTIMCGRTMTASLTGKCADGSWGYDPEVTFSLFNILRVGKYCEERDGETDGDFGCVCCTPWQCSQHRRYSIQKSAVFLGYDDDELLKKYPQLDCEANEECEAYCSDGVWVKDKSTANARRALKIAQYVFAIIDVTVEGVCVLIAFSYAIFGCCETPVKTSPISYLVLFVLNADDGDHAYTLSGRLVLFLHLVDDLVMVGLLMPFIIHLSSENVADRWEEIYAFTGSCVEILSFLKKIRIANADLGGPPKV
mmetsp:Transcript_16735/g.35362  ORF Transcript_16735/g.35362 Transcript_16735/m.35362 type:complete len:304 (-) Transcript_16735:164-1075(-)